MSIWLTIGDFSRNMSLSVLTILATSVSGLDIHELQIFFSDSDGSGGQSWSREWSWVTEWVASEAGVSLWSLLPRSSRPKKGVPYWTCWGGVWTARLDWMLVGGAMAAGVPISSLALGWRKTLSSKSPSASTFISYSRFRDFLKRGIEIQYWTLSFTLYRDLCHSREIVLLYNWYYTCMYT